MRAVDVGYQRRGAFCAARILWRGAGPIHGHENGDLGALAQDLVAKRPTIIDLPSAVWHLLCDDGDALDAIPAPRLRQIVIGGEAVRPAPLTSGSILMFSQGISLYLDLWSDRDYSRW